MAVDVRKKRNSAMGLCPAARECAKCLIGLSERKLLKGKGNKQSGFQRAAAWCWSGKSKTDKPTRKPRTPLFETSLLRTLGRHSSGVSSAAKCVGWSIGPYGWWAAGWRGKRAVEGSQCARCGRGATRRAEPAFSLRACARGEEGRGVEGSGREGRGGEGREGKGKEGSSSF